MKPLTNHKRRNAAAASLAAVCLVVAFVPGSRGQGDEDVRLREAEVAVGSLVQEIAELKKALVAAEAKVSALGESLASANAESNHFREAYRKIRLQMEALGVAVLDADSGALEQRLLQAVNDRRLLEEENEKLREQLNNLTEALLVFMKSSVGAEPEARDLAEEAVRNAEAALLIGKGPGENAGGDMNNARIVSVKDEFGLVVFNVGAKQGVREGMPFRVIRKDRPIGTVMVVDVRDKICGAVVQTIAEDENFAVGDTVRVDAE